MVSGSTKDQRKGGRSESCEVEFLRVRQSGTLEVEMDSTAQKSLERAVSQRALQISSSFPCKVCAAGFLFGVCFTYFFLAALTPTGILEFSGFLYSNPPAAISPRVRSESIGGKGCCSSKAEERGKRVNLHSSDESDETEKVKWLYSAWSAMLDGEVDVLNNTNIPNAPHLENCELLSQINKQLDGWSKDGSFPPWTILKGMLGLELLQSTSKAGEQTSPWRRDELEKAYPPWIVGADEDNIPLTRKVQRDLWIHQHPQNCSDPEVQFLLADWEKLPGFGIGAQFAGMSGILAIAVNERRVLVTNYYNRADHDDCLGESRSHWSCYFLPETSAECRRRALELTKRPEAWKQGIIKGKENYTSKEIWTGRIPRIWGSPWDYMQPTTEIDGILVKHHRKMDRRWWRAQAIRYLMRFQSEYTCRLLNIARHKAFGMEASRMVLGNSNSKLPKDGRKNSIADIERLVWSDKKAWMPRPLLSMHVRMGDKAVEMKVVGFEAYMSLADRMRKRFPDLKSIWLSTEMQEVIDKTKSYPHWNFYYTNVKRQTGNTTMATYEASLGRKMSTNYPIVNFLMASEADFFIGALGSTWCFLIDGMRNTGGKVMSGYLSVNKDRFW